jgi:glycosyltransferase involved in cell wall biosynthesis
MAVRDVLDQAIEARRQLQSRRTLRAYSHSPSAEARPQVSVVMPTYNAQAHVQEAVRSILRQTLTNIELIVVDDASTDDTVARVRAITATDSRVRLFTCTTNRGPYWARNLGWLHSRAPYIANQDADDTSSPERLAAQVGSMERSGAVLSVTNYQRVDATTGLVVMNRGLPERLSYQSMLIRRDRVLQEVGFYDSVRFAADDELYHRIIKRFSPAAISHIRRPLYKAKVVATSLTFMDRSSLEPSNDAEGHLSPTRKEYVTQYRRWHESTQDLRMPFPLRRRPFPIPDGMLPEDGVVDDRLVASVASISARSSGLERVVATLSPQVDLLTVYLNGYGHVPAFLRRPNVVVARSEDHGRVEDNGKFFFDVHLGGSGIHCTVDDDLDYPLDYVSRSVAKLLQYGRQAVIGHHGIRIRDSFASYYDLESREVHSYRLDLLEDRPVHILGTGTVTYDRSVLGPGFRDFGAPRMADIWLALYAKKRDVPLVCAAHDRGLLRDLDAASLDSLYESGVRDDTLQTRAIVGAKPWPNPVLPFARG